MQIAVEIFVKLALSYFTTANVRMGMLRHDFHYKNSLKNNAVSKYFCLNNVFCSVSCASYANASVLMLGATVNFILQITLHLLLHMSMFRDFTRVHSGTDCHPGLHAADII